MGDPGASPQLNRYQQIIEHVFRSRFRPGDREVAFEREDLVGAAQQLGVDVPKNLGDILYTFRYRGALPASIRELAPPGEEWVIRPAGKGRYRFVATKTVTIAPNMLLAETKIPDATPGLIAKYALTDEQALLAKIRYNRLVDIFTGVTCYSLQSHLRTAVPGIGQVETDEIYIGVDRRGAEYVLPIQAKGSRDKIGIVQIEQDFALCARRFPLLLCRPIAAQALEGDRIALIEFEEGDSGVVIASERHYRLVPPDAISPDDLEAYRLRPLS